MSKTDSMKTVELCASEKEVLAAAMSDEPANNIVRQSFIQDFIHKFDDMNNTYIRPYNARMIGMRAGTASLRESDSDVADMLYEISQKLETSEDDGFDMVRVEFSEDESDSDDLRNAEKGDKVEITVENTGWDDISKEAYRQKKDWGMGQEYETHTATVTDTSMGDCAMIDLDNGRTDRLFTDSEGEVNMTDYWGYKLVDWKML